MVRFLASTAFLIVANALGLLVAAWLLDGVTLSGLSFVIAVAIFTGVSVLIRPFLLKLAVQHFDALMGGTALMATLIALIVTAALSDGLNIDGFDNWLLATIIVWLVAVIAGIVLPMLFLKKMVTEARSN
jgi:putative membrane protein